MSLSEAPTARSPPPSSVYLKLSGSQCSAYSANSSINSSKSDRIFWQKLVIQNRGISSQRSVNSRRASLFSIEGVPWSESISKSSSLISQEFIERRKSQIHEAILKYESHEMMISESDRVPSAVPGSTLLPSLANDCYDPHFFQNDVEFDEGPCTIVSARPVSTTSMLSSSISTTDKSKSIGPKPVFISYCRRNKADVAKIYLGLGACDVDCWVDWVCIAKGDDWWASIRRGIITARVFVFMMSWDSLNSKICMDELNYAFLLNKRVIVIVLDDLKHPETGQKADILPKLSTVQWIFCRSCVDDVTEAVTNISDALAQDFDLLQQHTMYLIRALDWRRECVKIQMVASNSGCEDEHDYLNIFELEVSDVPVDSACSAASTSWLWYKRDAAHLLLDSESVNAAFEFVSMCSTVVDVKPTVLQYLYFDESKRCSSLRSISRNTALLGAVLVSLILGVIAILSVILATRSSFAADKIIEETHTCSLAASGSALISASVVSTFAQSYLNLGYAQGIIANKAIFENINPSQNSINSGTMFATTLSSFYSMTGNSSTANPGRVGVNVDIKRKWLYNSYISGRAAGFTSLVSASKFYRFFSVFSTDYCSVFWDSSISLTLASSVRREVGSKPMCGYYGVSPLPYPFPTDIRLQTTYLTAYSGSISSLALNSYGMMAGFRAFVNTVNTLPMQQYGEIILGTPIGSRNDQYYLTLPGLTPNTCFSNSTVTFSKDGLVVASSSVGYFGSLWIYVWDVFNANSAIVVDQRLTPSITIPNPILIHPSSDISLLIGDIVGLSSDGTLLVSGYKDSFCIAVFDTGLTRPNPNGPATLGTPKLRGFLSIGFGCIKLLFSNNDDYMIVTTAGNYILFFNISIMLNKLSPNCVLTSSKPLSLLNPDFALVDDSPDFFSSVLSNTSISSDDEWVAATANDFQVRLWDVKDAILKPVASIYDLNNIMVYRAPVVRTLLVLKTTWFGSANNYDYFTDYVADYCSTAVSVNFDSNWSSQDMEGRGAVRYPYELAVGCEEGVMRFAYPFWRLYARWLKSKSESDLATLVAYYNVTGGPTGAIAMAIAYQGASFVADALALTPYC